MLWAKFSGFSIYSFLKKWGKAIKYLSRCSCFFRKFILSSLLWKFSYLWSDVGLFYVDVYRRVCYWKPQRNVNNFLWICEMLLVMFCFQPSPTDRAHTYIDAVLNYVQYLTGLDCSGKLISKTVKEEFAKLCAECIALIE